MKKYAGWDATRLLAGLMLLLLAGVGNPAYATEPLRIAVAANFAAPLKALLPQFEQQTGIPVVITVASTGTLFAQLQQHAPFDVFLAADTARPQRLAGEQRIIPGSRATYAVGQLVWVSRQLPAGISTTNPDLQALLVKQLSNSSQRLAIANPTLAPYGQAARQVLTRLGLWETMQPRLVRATNVLQAYRYLQTGLVDSALVAASLVLDSPHATIPLPASWYRPVRQQLIIPKQAPQPTRARQFSCWLLSAAVQQQLPKWGYQPGAASGACAADG